MVVSFPGNGWCPKKRSPSVQQNLMASTTFIMNLWRGTSSIIGNLRRVSAKCSLHKSCPQGRHSSGSAFAFFGLLFWLKCLLWIHPWRLIWNIIMEVWKIICLSKCVICRFHVYLPGCKRKCILDFYKKCRICILPQGPQNHKPSFTQQPPITWKRHDKKHPKKPKILFWLVVWLNPSEKYSYSSNWTLFPQAVRVEKYQKYVRLVT